MDGRLVPALGGAATRCSPTASWRHRLLLVLVDRSGRGPTAEAVPLSWSAVHGRARALRRAGPRRVPRTSGPGCSPGGRRPRGPVGRDLGDAGRARPSSTAATPSAAARGPIRPGDADRRSDASLRETTAAYFQLTKPRIIVLLLITTVPAMMLAERGMPSIVADPGDAGRRRRRGGLGERDQLYLDRDIDEMMRRTRQRPLPAHAIAPGARARLRVRASGRSRSSSSSIAVNVLAASLALAAIAFYVFVYTMWLKRTTARTS